MVATSRERRSGTNSLLVDTPKAFGGMNELWSR
jgi:hypothetical protein